LARYDSANHTFALRLDAGKNATEAVRQLYKNREIDAVWADGTSSIPLDRDPLSVAGLERRIAEQKQAHAKDADDADEPEHQLPLHKGARVHEDNEKAGTDYLRALQAFLKIRAYPYNRVDWSAYDRAMDHINAMPRATPPQVRSKAVKPGTSSSGNWAYVGPNNLNTPYRVYYGFRPSSGRINAIAYDPSHTGTYYLGGGQGGVWKTTNSGTTWTALTDTWPYLSVSAITLDPTNSSTIYVGTGDYHGELPYSFGIMKSTDGGIHWSNYGRSQFGDTDVSTLLVDPDTTSIITVATGRGQAGSGYVWRSTDGGQTWSQAISVAGEWSGATIGIKGSSGSRYYYAVTGGSSPAIYQSSNQGATWTKTGAPSFASGYAEGLSIAASAVDANTVYLLDGHDQKIYKSTNAGSSWTDITGSFPTYSGYDWSQWWYDYYISVFANSGKDDIFVGLISVAESPDGGTTWQDVGLTATNSAITHNDQHSFAVNPSNTNEVLIGNGGGIYKGTRSGSTWSITGLSKNLGVTMFYNAQWHPTDPSMMIGGTQDNATPVVLNDDLADWQNVAGGDGFWAAIKPDNTKIQYATIYDMDVIWTTDMWNTEYDISPNVGSEPTSFYTHIFQDPVNTQYLYGCTDHLWRWNANSQAWTGDLGGKRLSNGGMILTVAVAPSNGSVIYTGSDDAQIYWSTNGGGSFSQLGESGLPNRSITSISVNPTNPYDILVGFSGTGTGHLFRCANTKASSLAWTSVGGTGSATLPDLPLNCIERDGYQPSSSWFVGTDLGVYKSTNSGSTWANMTAPLGLPNVQVVSMNYNLKTGWFSCATYGRGIWRIPTGSLYTLAPSSFKVDYGTLIGGGLGSLTNAGDGNVMTVQSAYSGALVGQVAGVEAAFAVPTTTGSIAGLTFNWTASANVQGSTEQVYVEDFSGSTPKWDYVTQFTSPTSLTSQTISVTGSNPAAYQDSSGNVHILVRTILPGHVSTSAFILSLDQMQLVARTSS
jgi:hypothetical protein